MSLNKMIEMITPSMFHCFYAWSCTCCNLFFIYVDVKDGNITAVLSNPAVTLDLLSEIKSWHEEGATVNDVVERLRLRTVPHGYTIHSWIEGAIVDNQHNDV